MARHTHTAPQEAELTLEKMEQALPRLRKRVIEVEALDPNAINENPRDAVRPIRASIDDALVRTFGAGTVDYKRYSLAASLDDWPLVAGGTPLPEIRKYVGRNRQRAIDLLRQAIASLEERIEEAGGATTAAAFGASSKFNVTDRRAFVVHGHNEGARETIARFLEKIGFEPIILHEKANQGRTIIEKFEAHAEVGFAVVLLTPDDVGGPDETQLQRRARQNVILELGYFIGRLGRARVCALKSGEIELPSDILGVVWTPFDPLGAWKFALAKELEAADYEIDWKTVSL